MLGAIASEEDQPVAAQRLSRGERVALMRKSVAKDRDPNAKYMFKTDQPQGVAIDELIRGRASKNLETSRKSNLLAQSQGSASGRPSKGKSIRKSVSIRESRDPQSSVNQPKDEEEDVVEAETQVTRCGGLCAGQTGTNLLVMLWIWATSTTCFEMLNLYVRLLPGNVYGNFAMAGIAEMIGQAFAAVMFARISPKITFSAAFVISIAGAIVLIVADIVKTTAWLYFLGVFTSMFGVAMALCGSYVATPYLFPTMVCGTAFGVCNIFGRFMTIVSPALSEMHAPIPMIVFSIFSSVAGILSLRLNKLE